MNIKLLEKALDKESFYVLVVILLNIANLLLFSKNDLMILINSILVLAILVIFFYATSLQFLRLQLPFGSDLLQQQAESTRILPF